MLHQDYINRISKDEEEAIRWYRLAAEQRDARALNHLGVAYANGLGVPKDEREAVRWYRRAAVQGAAEAQYNLGVMYANGQGVPKDEGQAKLWFRFSADQGYAEAQYNLDRMYALGRSVTKEENEARATVHAQYPTAVKIEQIPYDALVAQMEAEHPELNPELEDMYDEDVVAELQEYKEAFEAKGLSSSDALKKALKAVYMDEPRGIFEIRVPDIGSFKNIPIIQVLVKPGDRVNVEDPLITLESDKATMDVPAPRTGVVKDIRVKVGDKVSQGSLILTLDAGAVMPSIGSSTQGGQSVNGQPVSGNSVRNDDSITKFLEDAFAGFVGLDSVRDEVFRQASYIQVQKLRAQIGLRVPTSPSRHLVFLGNPGTGKTTIARIIAGLYRRLGILKTDKVIETDRAGLVAAYVGQTALKTREIVESALGGILFIDEAYSLARGGEEDFGKEAIETLLKMMEDHRDELIVIVAGYEEKMDSFIKLNPGLESRFNRYIRFPNYNPEQLLTIFVNMCTGHSYVASETIYDGLRVMFGREIQAQRQRFSNARYVRNLFEKVIEAQAHRLYKSRNTSQTDLQTIMPSDVESALGEALPSDGGPSGNYEAALKRLNGLIGLDGVKKQVQRLFDFIRIQRSRAETGIKVADGFSQHLVFTGNPGTGKTTVARIIADLYFALGVIPSNRIVEVDRSGLVAGYIGQSAIKTREVVESALGGVLFIDEAYALAKGDKDRDFGQEVIDTLLKAMEDYRDQLVVIVAGYHEPMDNFINSNPGLRSRFNRYIEFENYGPDDLVAIFDSFCRHAEYELDSPARIFLSENLARLSRAGQTKDNARFVRNLFERCVEVQSQRVSRNAEVLPENLIVITVFDVAGALREVIPEVDHK